MSEPSPVAPVSAADRADRVLPIIVGISVPVFWFGAAALSIMPLMMSVMLFDAPGSEDNPYLMGVFASLVSFPIFAVLSGVGAPVLAYFARVAPSRQAYRRRLAGTAVWSLLPLLSAVSAVFFFVLLGVICDGDFGCGY